MAKRANRTGEGDDKRGFVTMSPKQLAEIDDKLIDHMRKLSLEQLKAALEELRRSKKFIRGTKGNQLVVPLTSPS